MSKRGAAHLEESPDAPRAQVRLVQNLRELESLLEARRAYAATAFGYLEPRFFAHTLWHVAEGYGEPALLLQVKGVGGTSLYTQGSLSGLEVLWRAVSPPRYSYITFEAQHQEVVRRFFLLRGLQPLIRMGVGAATFRPVPSQAEPLGPPHLHQVNKLYRSGGGVLLSRQHLAEGDYYGIWEGKELVSIAGTQMVSQRYGVAVVVNVLTHPEHRARGYATQCVGALTAALLGQVSLVVLNVDPENTPALRAYRRLGYRETGRLGEAWAIWKGYTLPERLLASLYDWFSR